MMRTNNRKKEYGNALFLILIAVALFAALSYAITRSGRSGSTSIDKEKASLYAAQITATSTRIFDGVQRMVLMGTSLNSIKAGTGASGSEAGVGSMNGDPDFCTTGTDCLFAPEGGGVSLPDLPKDAFETTSNWPSVQHIFEGPTSHQGMEIDALPISGSDSSLSGPSGQVGGTSANESLILVFPLKKDVCTAINKGLGISGIPTTTTWPDNRWAACLLWRDYIYVQIIYEQ